MMSVDKTGFTLIEMIVVVCLFALVATLGITQLSFLDATLAHAELDKFANVCSYMQQHAIASNTEMVLTCDTAQNKYYGDNVRESLTSPIMFGAMSGVRGSPGSPSHVIEKAVTFPRCQIHFYPTGIISSGTVYLTDKKKQYMYALSNAVSQVSYLRFYRYDGKWKLLP